MNIDALHSLTLSNKDEASVTVNQRSLIDKILSRYSSENTLLRELIQNADDADAKAVVITYESIVEPPEGHPEDLNKRLTKRLTVKNDGQRFRPEDWMRLARIAEGNPADGRIGAYGVGFYAVFSLCDDPFIVSGDQSLAMYWRNDQLFTRTAKLPVNDDWTTFSLNMREPVEIPQLKSLTRFLANALTFSRSVQSIELRLDSTTLCTLKRVASPASPVSVAGLATTTQDKALRITKVESTSVQITATYENITQAVPKADGLGKFLSFFKEQPKIVSGTSTSTIFLRVMTAHLASSLTPTFAKELQRATKKPPPKQTKVQLVTMSRMEHEASTPAVIFEQLQAYPNQGRVYIGFPTHQTTGFSGHVGAPCLIPTVERESIDLVDRFVKVWNFEVLCAVGLLTRIAYHHEFNKVETAEDALFLTRYFSFNNSTPLRVDAPIEESFFGASTTLPLYTNKGVQSSSLVRLPDSSMTFLETVPVLPLAMLKEPFVQKLQQLGLIEAISIGDIRKDLQNRVLSEQAGLVFLRYCSVQSSRMDREALQSLLSAATIVSFNATTIKTWSNTKVIPTEAPLPPTCLPASLSAKLSEDEMRSLGWTELRILPWVEFCAGVEAFGRAPPMDDNPDTATLVLATVSKNFERINPVDLSEVVRLLQQRKCVPTRNHGMQKPGAVYFVHSKLFDDLPLVQVKGVKDKLLTALGVRKTIELDLIFERLLKGGTWTAYDLVLYLASVRRDIPVSDMERLKRTSIAESESSSEKRRASDLYEPHDTLRQLGLPIIKWPKDKWKPLSEEASLLSALGLHKFAPATVLTEIMANTADSALFERALNYFILNFAVYGYGATYKPAAAPAFIPTPSGTRKRPTEVYADASARIFGFDILRRDLVPSAALLGVQRLPSPESLVATLLQSPTEDKRMAVQQFELLSMLTLNQETVQRLGKAAIIPIGNGFAIPSRCFFKSDKIEAWLGQVFELVDFGHNANQFLKLIGVRDHPSTMQIAGMLVNDAQQIYTLCGTEDRYRLLLLRIARELDTLKRDGHLLNNLKQRAVLVAHKYKAGGDQEDLIVSSLRSASEIVIVDDFTAFSLFKGELFSCPQDVYLEELYTSFGAVRLSTVVENKPFVTGRVVTNQTTEALRSLVLERITVFLADSSIKPLHDVAWLTNNLKVSMCEKVSVQRTLNFCGTRTMRQQQTTAIIDGSRELVIGMRPDYYDVAVAVCKMMLRQPRPSDSLLLDSLMSNPLETLKARGYNVNRILQRQEKLKREREEQQRVLLEQDKAAEAAGRQREKEQMALQQTAPTAKQEILKQPSAPMPGAFPPSGGLFSSIKKGLGYRASDTKSPVQPDQSGLTDAGKSIRSQLSSDTNAMVDKAIKPTRPVQTVASQASIDASLNKAIRATQPSDSSKVFSRKLPDRHVSGTAPDQPQTTTVREASTYCDEKPATDLVLLATLTNGLKLFGTRGMDGDALLNGDLAKSAACFSVLLAQLAGAFGCNPSAINLFYDEAGSTIAFNKSGTIYCNLRYYHQLSHATSSDGSAYWYVTLAHEIAHNLVSEHSSAHEFYTESLIVAHLKSLIPLLKP